MTTKTRKIESYYTEFASKVRAVPVFERLFDKFRRATIILSYSSNGIPGIGELTVLLKRIKTTVEVVATPLKYSHGNQRHRVGSNHNAVQEYILIGK